MRSIDQNNKPVYLVYFDTCVYRKTLYAELIKLAEFSKIECGDLFHEVNEYQKKWNIEGKSYQDYLNFLVEIYQQIYKKYPKELEESAGNFSSYINLHRYKYFEYVRSNAKEIYFITDLPTRIAVKLFGKNMNVDFIDTKKAEEIVDQSVFIASSKKHAKFFRSSRQPIFFNPTKDLLQIKDEIDNLKIVIERKDIVYYNISFEKFF